MLFRIHGFLEYWWLSWLLPSALLLFKHQAMVLIRITFKNERPGNIVQKLLDDVHESKREARPVCIYVFPFIRKEADYSVITNIEAVGTNF